MIIYYDYLNRRLMSDLVKRTPLDGLRLGYSETLPLIIQPVDYNPETDEYIDATVAETPVVSLAAADDPRTRLVHTASWSGTPKAGQLEIDFDEEALPEDGSPLPAVLELAYQSETNLYYITQAAVEVIQTMTPVPE